jgi:hypothetical protein
MTRASVTTYIESQHNKYFTIRDPWSFPNILHSLSDTTCEYTNWRNEDITHSNRHNKALRNLAFQRAWRSTRFTRVLSWANLWKCRESLHGPRISQTDLWNIVVLAEQFQLGVEFIDAVLVCLVCYPSYFPHELEI